MPTATLIVTGFGFNVVRFCIVFLVVLQTAYLTPPMAPSIFYLRGIAPPEIRLADMYRGVGPFIVLQVIVITVVPAFPQTVLWLPEAVR